MGDEDGGVGVEWRREEKKGGKGGEGERSGRKGRGGKEMGERE